MVMLSGNPLHAKVACAPLTVRSLLTAWRGNSAAWQYLNKYNSRQDKQCTSCNSQHHCEVQTGYHFC